MPWVILDKVLDSSSCLPCRSGEWYLEKHGSQKILPLSRNLEWWVSKSWFCVFLLVLESCIFFAQGSWSFGFVFWESNFLGNERAKLIPVSEESQCCTTSMLDEICMAFCWCTVQTNLLRFKLTGKLWNSSYRKKLCTLAYWFCVVS